MWHLYGGSGHVEECLKILHLMAVAKTPKKWRERPFVSQSNCFVVRR